MLFAVEQRGKLITTVVIQIFKENLWLTNSGIFFLLISKLFHYFNNMHLIKSPKSCNIIDTAIYTFEQIHRPEV